MEMEIQRVVHGDDMILGEKFPQERREALRQELLKQQEDEPDHEWAVRKYVLDKQLAEEEARIPQAERDFRDMNPDGFWEMEFTIHGIRYLPRYHKELTAIRNGSTFRIAKVVSQGLLTSDPVYIGKVLYSLRHPRAVAKSQERLLRELSVLGADGQVHNLFENLVIHSPEMFIQVSLQALAFLQRYPEIPVHVVQHEQLLTNPKAEIDKIAEFVGVGDYSKAYSVVKPQLDRSSKHEPVDDPLFEDAEFIYSRMLEIAELLNATPGGNRHAVRRQRKLAIPVIEDVFEVMRDRSRPYHRKNRQWLCYRAKSPVSEIFCQGCTLHKHVRDELKRRSERTPSQFGITKHWSQEPCLFECGMDVDRKEPYLTIEESIQHNFWIEEPQPAANEVTTDG
jgi:hypothetical protein